jgi:anti-sigma factor RsiW
MNQSAKDILELYLDGLLSQEQRREFEENLRRDPQLQAQVQHQQSIDQALKRLMQAPQPAANAVAVATHAAAAARRLARPSGSGSTLTAGVLKRMAIAAAFLGAIFGAWMS